MFKGDLEEIRRKGANPEYEKHLKKTIVVAYRLKANASETEIKNTTDLLSGHKVFEKCLQVFNNLEEWKRPFMAHSMQLLSDQTEDAKRTATLSKLAELVDRALHCK